MATTSRSVRISLITLQIIFILTLIFHLLVITQIIPFHIVWGGRLQSANEMYVFESVSIVLNSFFLVIIRIRQNEKRRQGNEVFLKWTFRLMSAVFTLNTVGNLFANNDWERFFFAPLTGVMAVLCLLIARENS